MAYELLPVQGKESLFFRMDGEAAERHGAIGYLRADFGRSGREFHCTWFDTQRNLKTPGFQHEFDEVINALRDDGQKSPFASRENLAAFCAAAPGWALGARGSGYMVRSPNYSYYFRCSPRPDDYDIYCHACDNHFLLPELAGKHDLPEKCFSVLPSSGELILINRGQSGYIPFQSDAAPKEVRLAANDMNGMAGVTRAQEEAMLAGSLFGRWDAPAAKPWHYDQNGRPRLPNQPKIMTWKGR